MHHEGRKIYFIIAHLPTRVITVKDAVRHFLGLKMIQNQYLSKYITSQCSKLSPYFSPIHNVGTGRFSREIRAWSLHHVCKHKVFTASRLYHM